eukprot:TRINITY_DN44_c0_g1_i2.p1 TRINITY_DN44_c0_g1~~TRINITY_DN44_c0_g1_i2.p1  ORF type:complete len:267 (-),score=74.71 TRINITY_DN44_c0_g1_i2:307-1107(-)
MIDQGSDWRNFGDSDKDKARASNVDPLLENSMGTSISATTFTGAGEGAAAFGSMMTKAQKKVANEGGDRGLAQACTRISEMSERLKFTADVASKAKHIYQQFDQNKKRIVRGSKTDATILAVLYMACRELNVHTTFKDLANDTGISEMEISKLFKRIQKDLPKSKSSSACIPPSDLVVRYAAKLKLSGDFSELASRIAKRAAPKLEGKRPSSIAAASIYMVLQQNPQASCNEKEIARVASLSASTIKNLFKEMSQWTSELLADEQR